jgi:hypothetical protein
MGHSAVRILYGSETGMDVSRIAGEDDGAGKENATTFNRTEYSYI